MTAQETLHRVFGYNKFRGNQADIIEHVINGKDAFVLMANLYVIKFPLWCALAWALWFHR